MEIAGHTAGNTETAGRTAGNTEIAGHTAENTEIAGRTAENTESAGHTAENMEIAVLAVDSNGKVSFDPFQINYNPATLLLHFQIAGTVLGKIGNHNIDPIQC